MQSLNPKGRRTMDRSLFISIRVHLYSLMFIMMFPLFLQSYCFGETTSDTKIISVRPTALEGYDFHHPAISPNGNQIAFSVSDKDNWTQNTIWVQDLESGRTWPVTQPDSTVNTGDVCVEWSPDGTKLSFGSDKNGEVHIYIVNIDGTGLKKITENPISHGQGWFGISSWSKDGRKIIYPHARTDANPSGIYEYDLSQSKSKVLREFPTQHVSDPDLSPDGHKVVYVVGEDLEILDLETKEIQKLECDISGARMPKWSPDGKWIGFQVNYGGWRTYILPHKGGKAIKVGPGKDHWTQVPSWSSDGNSIVYHGKKHETQRVYIQDFDTGEVFENTKNIAGWSDWRWANWSNDGQFLAYVARYLESDIDGYTLTFFDISSKSFKDVPLIFNLPALGSSIPPWKSKIGQSIEDDEHFVAVVQENEFTQLALISAKTLGIKRLTNSPSVKSSPTPSSDGELIAYTSNVEGVEEIWIYDRVTEEEFQLTFVESDNERGATFVGKWGLGFSPSGSKIVFGQDNGETRGDIMIVEVDNGELTQLTSDKGWDVNPRWLDDITFSYTSHPESIQHRFISIKNLVSDELITISTDAHIFNPFWHAHSKTFYFNDQSDDKGIIVANMENELTDLLSRGRSGIPSPSGRYIVYLELVGETAPMDIWMEKLDDIVLKSAIP